MTLPLCTDKEKRDMFQRQINGLNTKITSLEYKIKTYDRVDYINQLEEENKRLRSELQVAIEKVTIATEINSHCRRDVTDVDGSVSAFACKSIVELYDEPDSFWADMAKSDIGRIAEFLCSRIKHRVAA